MSISGSLANALSGLNAAARAAEVVSANVSNALTEGYGRRELNLAARSLGGHGAGVAVVGITRHTDEQVIGARRLADAEFGGASVSENYLARLQQVFGLPDDPNSLSGLVAGLEANLIEAASRPDSEPRLNAVLDAARKLTGKLNQSSDEIQALRLSADQEIDRQVKNLNSKLARIADLNNDIRVQLGAGFDATALMDQRQQAIDSISQIVPLKQVARGNGQIALFTPGGAILLDGRPATVGFTPVGTIVAQMTATSGGLSGLTLNGQPVSPAPDGPLGGGSLGALFDVRDNQAVTAQIRLDAVARDLIERFADPSVDPTISTTDPGLFADTGAGFNPANEIGLSGRISVNSLVDPDAGGALWRLRDGLGATAPGDVGNAGLLNRLVSALGLPRVPASGGFIGAARSAVGLAGDLASLTNIDLRAAEADKSYGMAKVDALKTLELQGGVDTDHELQNLLLVEQAFAANARVVSTVDEMIQTLLGL